jgi:hypothetical protein
MPTYPNTGYAKSGAVNYGSCMLELSEDGGFNFVNVGVAKGVTFNEEIVSDELQSDNSPPIKNQVSSQKVTIGFGALEFYLPTLEKMRGGLDILSVTSAAKSTRTDSILSSKWRYNQPIYLSDLGDSTTGPSISNVKTISSNGGTSIALTTGGFDIVKNKDSRGITNAITVLDTKYGGDALDSEKLRIKYVIGAIAKRKLTSGGLATITSIMFRLTNKQIVGGVAKYRKWVVYSATINSGLNLAFKASGDADSRLETPFSIVAQLDTSRTEGDQLFYIEDEVGIA